MFLCHCCILAYQLTLMSRFKNKKFGKLSGWLVKIRCHAMLVKSSSMTNSKIYNIINCIPGSSFSYFINSPKSCSGAQFSEKKELEPFSLLNIKTYLTKGESERISQNTLFSYNIHKTNLTANKRIFKP